jgi:hypothetical protein
MRLKSWMLAGMLAGAPLAAMAQDTVIVQQPAAVTTIITIHELPAQPVATMDFHQMHALASALEQATDELQKAVRRHSNAPNQHRTEKLVMRAMDTLEARTDSYLKAFEKNRHDKLGSRLQDVLDAFLVASNTFTWQHMPATTSDEFRRVQDLMAQTVAMYTGYNSVEYASFIENRSKLILREDENLDYSKIHAD